MGKCVRTFYGSLDHGLNFGLVQNSFRHVSVELKCRFCKWKAKIYSFVEPCIGNVLLFQACQCRTDVLLPIEGFL